MRIPISFLAGLLAAVAWPLLTATSQGKKGGGNVPPANPAIVFVGYSSNKANLTAMNADGSNRTVLIASGSAMFGTPKWSPDGSKICFMIRGQLSDNVLRQGLALLDVAVVNGAVVASGFRMLVSDLPYYPRPAWSPDGTYIAYTHAAGAGIYRVPAAGGQPTLIVEDRGVWAPISFSPDGTRIAYRRIDANDNGWLSVLRLSDLGITHVCPMSSDIRNIDWARTSDRILIDAGDSTGVRISIVDAVENAVPVTVVNSAWFPAWSPDDARIVYTQGTADSIVIRVLATGSVTSTGAKGRQIDWRRF